MTYLAYGLRIRSEMVLPIPRITIPPGVDVDVDFQFGSVDTSGVTFSPFESLEENDDDPWLARGWSHNRTLLEFPDLVAEFNHTSNTIVIDAPKDLDVGYMTHVVLDHVVPRWLYLRGDTVLHGGSVVSPSGRAVTFVGDTGQGKSSLVTALARASWPLLGDDACRVVRRAGTWWAYPSYHAVRLNGAARAALLPAAPSTPMAAGSDKHRVVPPGWTATEPAPLGLVIELGDGRNDTALRRLTLGESVAALTRHSFCMATSASAMTRDAFLRSGDVAAEVPVVHLEYPRTWDVYPELIALIEATEGSLR